MTRTNSEDAWERGPALSTPAEALVAWFVAQHVGGEPRLTRAPVVLARGPMGWSLAGAALGPLRVRLDDAALGIGIATRAQACREAPCAFLVEGWWSDGPDGPALRVRRASERPLGADELMKLTHLEVQRAPTSTRR